VSCSRAPLCRRSRFWLRFAGVLVAIVLPGLVRSSRRWVSRSKDRCSDSDWFVAVLIASSRLVLFHGWGVDPGPDDGNGEGPRPEDGPPTPPAPVGGVPFPAAEPSSTRVRDPRPTRRASRPRRPIRERQCLRSLLWPLRVAVTVVAVLASQLSAHVQAGEPLRSLARLWHSPGARRIPTPLPITFSCDADVARRRMWHRRSPA
jgi:hypothetical protein